MDYELTIEKTFHGILYIIGINATTECLTIDVEQKSNGDGWTASFTSQYLEDITSKTGNFKKYGVFLKMLQSALSGTTDTVYIDILTYQDLEAMKNKRANQIPQTNKRYVILSYIAEFDKVHYPLPLNFNDNPNTQHMKQTIIKLRNENESLNEQNAKLTCLIEAKKNDSSIQEYYKEIEYLKQMLETKEKDILELKNQIHTQNVKKTEYSDLKQKYVQQETQQAEHTKKIAELQDYLGQVIDENSGLKLIEKKLKSRIVTLEQELQIALQRSHQKTGLRPQSRSPSLNKPKQVFQVKKQSAQKTTTTPSRQRKSSIDSDQESSYRKKTIRQKPADSPSARSNSSKNSKSSKRSGIKSNRKLFTKPTQQTKNTEMPSEEQRLLEKLKDLRERNKENTVITPSSKMMESSDDLVSIDDRLGKLTNLLKKVKNS